MDKSSAQALWGKILRDGMPYYADHIAWDVEDVRQLAADRLYHVLWYLGEKGHMGLTADQLFAEALRIQSADAETPAEVETLLDSQIECGNCRSKGQYARNVYVEQKQTRSGDEGMTAFAQCRTCRKRWKFAG